MHDCECVRAGYKHEWYSMHEARRVHSKAPCKIPECCSMAYEQTHALTITVLSVISSVLAFCLSVTLKKRSYEGLAPPWKLSQIVEIRFLQKVSRYKNSWTEPFFCRGVVKSGTFCQNVRPLREHFHISHENESLVWNSRCLVGKHFMWLTSVIENITRVQAL